MKAAVREVHELRRSPEIETTSPAHCGVSCDGTWQRRVHSLLNGCVTVISMDTGKVLDVEALSTHCKEMNKNSITYLKWQAEHKNCKAALCKLKKEVPGLGGKGKLTNSMIDKLENYYGTAIRSNVGSLEGMTKAVHASLFHCVSTEAKPYHVHCPTGSDSWCRYQQDKANNTNLYKHGAGLPKEVIKHVKPIYERLSEPSLLEKCLHGKTQNQNEALNGMIWQRIPKEVFVHRDTLELGG